MLPKFYLKLVIGIKCICNPAVHISIEISTIGKFLDFFPKRWRCLLTYLLPAYFVTNHR